MHLNLDGNSVCVLVAGWLRGAFPARGGMCLHIRSFSTVPSNLKRRYTVEKGYYCYNALQEREEEDREESVSGTFFPPPMLSVVVAHAHQSHTQRQKSRYNWGFSVFSELR